METVPDGINNVCMVCISYVWSMIQVIGPAGTYFYVGFSTMNGLQNPSVNEWMYESVNPMPKYIK